MGLITSFPGGNGGSEIKVDSELSTTSENPVQNKVITTELNKKANSSSIPTQLSQLTGDSTHRTVTDTEKGTWNGKQDALTAGNGIDITNNVISAGIPIVANQFEKSDLYSTTEKVVGCWTDGRPVYQKTISCGTFPNNATKQVAHGISNLGQVVKIFGFAKNTVNNEWNMIPIAMQSSNLLQYQVRCKITLTNVEIITGTSYEQAMDCYVTIQYTKTTDAANSFNYADENDYSTSEKIVGTWIDGKPVYQRTFSKNNVSLTNNSYSEEITIANLKQVIKFSPYVKGSNGYAFTGTYGDGDNKFGSTCWTYQGALYFGFRLNTPTADYSFTIQYTKTTD